jgi:hypothetical protein
MKRYILFLVLFALLIGTSIANNVKTGEVEAFRKR